MNKSCNNVGCFPAFTLVELLVTIGIIGILVALLLPAVAAVRESARNASCKNNIRQVGLAISNFDSAYQKLPASNWIVDVLPYLELQSFVDSLKERNTDALARASIAVLSCPSDIGNKPSSMIYTSYQGNCGVWPGNGRSNGPLPNPTFEDPKISMASISDGLSNTALVAECLTASTNLTQARLRYMWMTPGASYGPDEFDEFHEACVSIPPNPLESGWRGDPMLRGGFIQLPDESNPNVYAQTGVGATVYNHVAAPQNPSCTNGGSFSTAIASSTSNHASTVNVVFCDGHVASFSSGVELDLWRQLGDRDGSNPY